MSSSNNSCFLLIFFSLLLLLKVDSSYLTNSTSCLRQCGGITIPFPFGIGKGCYLEKWYEVECKNSSISRMLEPFLSVIQKQVVSISRPSQFRGSFDYLPYGSVLIKHPMTSKGCSDDEKKNESLLNLTGTPFYVGFRNTLVAFGCNNTASLTNVEPNMVGCRSSCVATNPMALKDYFATISCNNKALTSGRVFQPCGKTSCNGTGCCKASMPDDVQQVVGVKIEDTNTRTRGCTVAFLTAEAYSMLDGYSTQKIHDLQYSTVEIGWLIHTTSLSFIDSLGCQNITEYTTSVFPDPTTNCVCNNDVDIRYASCACTSGYRGSPYTGCIDIDECQGFDSFGNPTTRTYCERGRTCVNRQGDYDCVYPRTRLIGIVIGASFGLFIFIGGMYWLYKFIRKQRRLNQKRKFFKRNGGLLLQQQLTSTEGNIQKTRVFSSRELEKATENFSLNRILGQGGQGTVYKGMLVDGRIVAVKKSKVVDEDQLEEFINEVVREKDKNSSKPSFCHKNTIIRRKMTKITFIEGNIVKLLGCCLETNVPVLVYEFIPNGNLFEHLHDEFDDYTFTTWEVRLRIAVDVAGALSYLHSAASSPIYHRDVKSTNIMLDEKYRAKVSDFGTSRSVTVDHTHLTTVVSGTMGYMDPEYFQSTQFTDKSDVYSFGVVLAELITGEKSISFLRSQENRTLATYFVIAMRDNKLFDIIDVRIRYGCKLDQITAVAKLARRCLNMKGKKRPNMREVSIELERIHSSLGDIQQQYVSEDVDGVVEVNIGLESWDNVAVTAPASQYNIIESSSSYSDVEPLFPLHTQ